MSEVIWSLIQYDPVGGKNHKEEKRCQQFQ